MVFVTFIVSNIIILKSDNILILNWKSGLVGPFLDLNKWDVSTHQAKVSHPPHAHTAAQPHTGSSSMLKSASKWSATTQRKVSAHHKSAHSLETALALAWSALSQVSRLTASFVQTALLHHSQKNFTISSRRQQTSASTSNVTDTISTPSTASFSSNQEFTDLPATTRHAEFLHQTGSTTHKQHQLSLLKTAWLFWFINKKRVFHKSFPTHLQKQKVFFFFFFYF